MKIPVWSDFAPPVEWGGKRRVVVTEPKPGKNDNLNAFGSSVSERIRQALMKQKRYSVVDPDSVSAVLAQSRVRTDVENALKPDVLISPVFVGAPTPSDSMTMIVTIRDVRGISAMRSGVASVRFAMSDPERAIPQLVQEVMNRLEEQARAPKFIFRSNGQTIRTNVEPRGRNDRQ
jgi:hypothetical protein